MLPGKNFFFALLFFTVIYSAAAQSPHSREVNGDTARVNLFNKLSAGYIQTHIDSVLYFGLQAKALSQKLNYPEGLAGAHLNLSKYHSNKGDYAEALEDALMALKAYDSLRLVASSAFATAQIAYIYKDMAGQNRTVEFIATGISYGKAAYEKYSSINDTPGMILSINLCGILYRDKSLAERNPQYYDTAFADYSTALALINISDTTNTQLGKLYNNLSQVYIEHKKDYRKGLYFLFKAVTFNRRKNNSLSLSHNYGNIANAYLQLHDYEQALTYANDMLLISRQIRQPTRIHDALYQLFQVYKESGHPDSALRYYILADRLTDSLTNVEKTRQVADLHTKYETQKKELAISQLHKEQNISKKKIVLLASALVLFVILATGMILLYRRVQHQKKKISLQSRRLEVMMKELHHRVKNNLQIVSSLLSLQAYKLDDEQTIAVLKESQQRVQAMSLIHQRLYKTADITAVNMKEYVTDLAESLISSYGYDKENFQLEINIEREMLDVDNALPIGLIINEMVTNAMKYAYGGIDLPALAICLADHHGNLVLTVRDNGIGIDEKSWGQKNNSFGKQLMAALGKQLRAQQALHVENGTEFVITIPGIRAA